MTLKYIFSPFEIVREHKLCLTLHIKIHMFCSLLLNNVGSLACH